MKVYLAAAMHRREEIRAVAKRLEDVGIKVTARWLEQNQRDMTLREVAEYDSADVFRADCLVRFSDDISTPTVPAGWCTCSRMEESGMAQAWGKMIVIVGGHQSVFDYFLNRVHLKDADELVDYLKNLNMIGSNLR